MFRLNLRLNLGSLVPPAPADPAEPNWPPYGPLINARLATIEVIRINGGDSPTPALAKAIETFARHIPGKVEQVEGERAQVDADANGRVTRTQVNAIIARRRHRRACDVAILLTPGLSDTPNSYCADIPDGGHAIVINPVPGPVPRPGRRLARRALDEIAGWSFMLCVRYPTRRRMLLAHELLHALKVPHRRERSATGHHCTRPDCILYPGVDWRSALAGLFNLGPPLDLCRACREEIASARAAAGGVYFEPNDAYDPMVHLDGMVRLNPHSALERIYRGQARAERNDRAGAIADFTDALRLGPGAHTAKCRFNRAGLHAQDRRWAEAIADYEAALAADPAHRRALENVTWILRECPDEAFRDAAKAQELGVRAERLAGQQPPALR
ncbi:MAG: hypothetical protein NTW19_02045 [Planctomycetota bacterium]|nr:hypothetical protein [Planctomycetota bacterium]